MITSSTMTKNEAFSRIITHEDKIKRSKLSISSIESKSNGNNLILSTILIKSFSSMQLYALIDSRAFANAFIDDSFAKKHHLQFNKLQDSRIVRTIIKSSSFITHSISTTMIIGNHQKEIFMFTYTLSHYSVILNIK